MRVVVAPDKFKSSMSAMEAAAAMVRGLQAAGVQGDFDICPMADGGEGTVDALVAATGGTFHTARVTGPLPGMSVQARFGVLGDGKTAVVEMAAASGLALLRADQRNPLQTTTYGTGELLLRARELGCRRIILGLGGSATTDGGVGCAQACGVRFEIERDGGTVRADRPLVGGDLPQIRRIDAGARKLTDVSITSACDVTNPLFGPRGAAFVYGGQKGAGPREIERLDRALRHLADVTPRLTNQAGTTTALHDLPGVGAAGGLGFGLMAYMGAELRPGVDLVIDAVKLRERLGGADLCITGEGRLDGQSLDGKAVIGVARLCKALNIRCIAIAGAIGDDLDAAKARAQGLTAWLSICPGPMRLEDAMTDARKLMESAVRGIGGLL